MGMAPRSSMRGTMEITNTYRYLFSIVKPHIVTVPLQTREIIHEKPFFCKRDVQFWHLAALSISPAGNSMRITRKRMRRPCKFFRCAV